VKKQRNRNSKIYLLSTGNRGSFASPFFPFLSQSLLLSLFQRFQHGGEAKNGSLGANCYSSRIEREQKERKGRKDSREEKDRGGETKIKKERETPPATRANDK